MIRIVLVASVLLSSLLSTGQKDCRSMDYQLQIKVNASVYNSTEAASSLSLNSSLATQSTSNTYSVEATKDIAITIPVVVHVLYNNSAQNISDAQIASQLMVLNNDYNGRNSDRSKVPSYFASLVGSGAFEFKLANVDSKGVATTGIIRKYTSIQMFGTDDRIKSSSIGGDDAWDRNSYLNIWVGNLAGGIMGYSSIPGSAPEKDGVVIAYNAFGTLGTATAPFNLGRTATHEIGHWMNLLHIWGDTYCGDDKVDDTPKQRMANKGCPGGKRYSCEQNANGDMYMNFMDLTSDACMNMFTLGQVTRMKSIFERGGARFALLFSRGLSGKTINQISIPSDVPSPVTNPEIISSRVSIYPNPASSIITVETPEAQESDKKMMTIYNGVGQPVITMNLTSTAEQVNVSQLKPGIYFVKITRGGSTTMLKFSKN